ncbi:MAG: molybdopterin molybdotransferase MoeA [Ignavibacteriae bacterium]|nr:molybdopterin molybdotransferase MoeA [Ignavibacteriota bacterium]
MISVMQTRNAIIASITKGREVSLSLSESLGCVVAEKILCPLDLPPFRQSGVDGYAFRYEDFKEDEQINIIGESSAGKSYQGEIGLRQAVRIFTGAEVPDGADTVVMQEKVNVGGNILEIRDEQITCGANIRLIGSHIKKNDSALARGKVIIAGTIGFLASMGFTHVKVCAKPRVVIIITGNELQKPGESLGSGQVYESNSVCLSAALRSMGITDVNIVYAADEESATRSAFQQAITSADFILFSGGISVGDYDFVGKVLEEEKVKKIFYKVKQRPGKPLFFGERDGIYIFGLPGNPASVLTCFYEYVYPALRMNMGYIAPFLQSISLPLAEQINTVKGLTYFLKAYTDYRTAFPLDGQPSYIMRSFAHANCLIVVPEDVEKLDEGELVEVHLLPYI